MVLEVPDDYYMTMFDTVMTPYVRAIALVQGQDEMYFDMTDSVLSNVSGPCLI